jgi:kynurenine formamidase
MHIIDLTHLFTSKMPVYPGDPLATLEQIAWLEKDGLSDFSLTTGMHVGTHMDGPMHMIPGGKKLSEFPVSHFFGHGKIVDAFGQNPIDSQLLSSCQLKQGDIVLVKTGFSEFYGQKKYFEEYPDITEDFAQKLIDARVKILGLDSPSPDRKPFAIHKMLLSRDILIIENLTNLDNILMENFIVTALPLNLDSDSAPARVIAHL